MKKKMLLSGLLLTLCLGLTACGNPLKQLPEATEENIYVVEDESTGNEAADEIIDVLTDEDEGGIDGDVTSFMVYDRDDDEEDKDESELAVEIVVETEEFEYTGYYIVVVKYDKEDGWEVDEFEMDEDEDCVCKPLTGVDEDSVNDTMIYYYGIDLDSSENVSIDIGDPYEEDGTYYSDVNVQLSTAGDVYSMEMTVDIVYEFYYSASSADAYWEMDDCTQDATYVPVSGVTEDDLWNTIYYNLDSFTVDDKYFYIYDSNMGPITPLTNDMYEEDGVYYNELTVQFEFVDYDASYLMEYYMKFQFSEYGYWELVDYEYPTSYEVTVTSGGGEPTYYVDDDILYDTIYWDLDYFYVDDKEFYILSDNMGEYEVLSDNVYEEDGVYYEEMTVQFEFVDDDVSYIMEYYMLFMYGYDGWTLIDYLYPDSYEEVRH